MINIVPGSKVSELDQAFLQKSGLTSHQLMERAADSFCDWYKIKFPQKNERIYVFCGPGNNGGDGLAISRILSDADYYVTVLFASDPSNCKKDFQENFKILPNTIPKIFLPDFNFDIPKNSVVIDALLGVGIDRPLKGQFLQIVSKLNDVQAVKIAVDLPSGLPADDVLRGTAFMADFTVTFQYPKLALLLPEHGQWIGQIEIVDIGIPNEFLNSWGSNKFFLQKDDISPRHRKFHQFSHKGDFGRVMLIGGSKGKMGSIILSSRAALRTGSGLVICQPPESENALVQIACSELMVENEGETEDLKKYDALGIGPGWGMDVSISRFEKLLTGFKNPVVIDADGLNLISRNPMLLESLPNNSILTPHLKEFERLVGESKNHIERMEKAGDFSTKHKCILVLKGAFTLISLPNGKQFFNSTGNQYMATAGSGDVLTGILTSFLGQGYTPENAAICGVFHHGIAGELASKSKRRGMIASDIIEKIPESFLVLDIS